MEEIKVITDGSVFGNPGPGAWACIVEQKGKEKKILMGFEKDTTNQRMELFPILKAYCVLPPRRCKIRFMTDSLYAIKVLTKAWKAKTNLDLIEAIWNEMEKHEVWFKWVPHDDNEAHELALKTLQDKLKEIEFGPY